MNCKLAISLLTVISLSVVLFCEHEALFSNLVFDDDCSQYTFPFYKIKNPHLFEGDLFYEYSIRQNTKGVIFIYSLFSRFMDPLIISKLLPYILCFFSALYIFLIGGKIYNVSAGFLASVIFSLHVWTFRCFSGGHPRAFAFPLLLACIFYIMKRSYFILFFILFLQILIYPPIAVVSLCSIFLLSFQIARQDKIKITWSHQARFFLPLVFAGILLLFCLYGIPDDFKGPLFSLREMVQMPEFYYKGRDPHFIDSWDMLREDNIAENVTGIPIYSFPTWFLFIISLVGLPWGIRKKIYIHPVLKSFCLSGVLLFVLAWVLFFHLYSPGRYLRYAPLIYLIFFSALTIERIFQRKVIIKGKWLISVLVISMIYLPFLKKDVMHYTKKGLYDFLAGLPADVLIAGHPYEMSEIPLITRRKVFIQFELSLPYYKNYYAKISQRTNDFFRLYYSNDINEVLNICRLHHIDYVVICKEHFFRTYLQDGQFYVEPFNTYIQRLIDKKSRDRFIFMNIHPKYRIYENDIFFVVNTNELLS